MYSFESLTKPPLYSLAQFARLRRLLHPARGTFSTVSGPLGPSQSLLAGIRAGTRDAAFCLLQRKGDLLNVKFRHGPSSKSLPLSEMIPK
jgi:hypothetical protein